ncbi:hypothetical protein [Larsenimonas rhizosphaerae]|uniref:Uncharacterized protein n=1 Tax=Larsenimonas rhizosphaerae TaxID=2944682 RepID=A0AA41ZKG6_9GAMM|nr:hypothetical protein [Larsenimonas rhizosphaerae]MCM2130941.1 hypothetical protein [Larsenimonas rhizosphaerae]MCX2523646.1 hypothetical protein [Larsenimonas rhizosphaerae]
MTRQKKTRSLADKVTIRTGRRKDYRQWRHDNPDEVTSSRRYVQKKARQRKAQAVNKQERMQREGFTLPLHGNTPSSEESH